MLDQAAIARLGTALVSRAGGYLRNPVRQDRVTCAVCATPVAGYQRCYQCSSHGDAGLADAIAFLTYAVPGQQSGYVMRGYKAPRPLEEHRTIVTLLILLALSQHADCPGALAGTPVTHWATVPSLPAKAGEHPLHRIVGTLASGSEVTLVAAAQARFPRDVNPRHFSANARLPPGSHVLLIDDTWVRGGRAQSAVLALREAAAAHVSVLVVARWVKEDFGDNAKFLREHASRDYDPEICPWTGSNCPRRDGPTAG
jgi:predicted amidophosphoribosyltransferase